MPARAENHARILQDGYERVRNPQGFDKAEYRVSLTPNCAPYISAISFLPCPNRLRIFGRPSRQFGSPDLKSQSLLLQLLFDGSQNIPFLVSESLVLRRRLSGQATILVVPP